MTTVKFSDVLEYIGHLAEKVECACCHQTVEGASLYRKKDSSTAMTTALCEDCKEFIEGLFE